MDNLNRRLMAAKRCSHTRHAVVDQGHINSGVTFFISREGERKMLSDARLFWFELETIYLFNRFWLCEVCVFWNGDREIMEMLEIKGNINDYTQN